MKKKIIKYLLLFLFVAIIVPMTACGKNNTPPTVSDTTPNETVIKPTVPIDDSNDYDVSKVNMYSLKFTYDGKPHSLTVTKRYVPEGVTVEYENNDQIEIGVYEVVATLKSPNGFILKTLTAKLTIEKAIKDVSKVKFDDAIYIWEPNTEYTITATNVPDNVRVEYENNTAYAEGTYEAIAKLYDKDDDELLKTLTAKLIVKYAPINDQTVFANKTVVANGETYSITLPEELSSSYAKVEYVNNSASTQGVYYARAIVTNNDGTTKEYHAVLTIDNPANAEFDAYVDDMFVYFLNGDQSTLNIFTADYKKYGFEHQEAKWTSYSRYTDEDYASDTAEIKRLNDEFNAFDYSKLSFSQQISYNSIKKTLASYDFAIAHRDMNFINLNYIDQFGGAAADIPSTMEGYTVRTEEDIKDIISYIDSVYDAFMTYVLYAKDRAEAGYPFTNFTIANMVSYLDGVSGRKLNDDEKTEYYLKGILTKKITDSQEALGLSDEQITSYVSQLDKAFDNFIKAHVDLANALEKECMNLNPNMDEFYLGSYGEKGKEVYEYLLRNRLGITMSIEEYIDFLDTTLSKYMNLYSSVSSAGNVDAIMNGEVKIIESNDVYDLIDYLKEFAKTIVPDLAATPEIDVAYMDKTVTANTTTLAYYMKSALDYDKKEYIHLNADALGKDYLETIKTLAHEGYPGHLYAYVSTKENANLSNLVRVLTNVGHGEGWAKYVEIALGTYIGNQKGGDWVNAMKKAAYWDLFVYNLYTRIDVGVNYEGWSPDEVYQYMHDMNLNVDKNSAKDLAKTLAEMPTQYASYGYGQSLFYELHEDAKMILGENYDEVEFNSMLLEHGWCGLSELENYYHEYMVKKCFLLGITYNE